MIRLRVLTSSRLDQDVEAHLSMLERLPRVQLDCSADPIRDQIALIIRQAVQMFGSTAETDALLTVGEPALVAGMLTWRGPLIHLPIGLLSKTERRLLLWRGEHSETAVVFSSYIAAADAVERGMPTSQVRVIRTSPPALHATRDQIRDKIGIDRNTTCILLAGRVREIGGHRSALATSAVLSFRDPTWRMLLDPGIHADYVRRFAKNTTQPGSIELCDQCSAPELAAAADAVIIDPETVPSFVSIASAAKYRVPIIADPRMWQREQLQHVPATLVDEGKSRYWARAVISQVENPSTHDLDRTQQSLAASHSESKLIPQWLEVLQTVSGRRKSQVA